MQFYPKAQKLAYHVVLSENTKIGISCSFIRKYKNWDIMRFYQKIQKLGYHVVLSENTKIGIS